MGEVYGVSWAEWRTGYQPGCGTKLSRGWNTGGSSFNWIYRVLNSRSSNNAFQLEARGWALYPEISTVQLSANPPGGEQV